MDTNILVSYLLTPNRLSPTTVLVGSAFAGEFQLLLPDALLEELCQAITTSRYLRKRITPHELMALSTTLLEIAEIIPFIFVEIPALTRDPKDDYLLAYAIVGQANYLVTGDEDLLALGQVSDLEIVSPRRFLAILREKA